MSLKYPNRLRPARHHADGAAGARAWAVPDETAFADQQRFSLPPQQGET
jgi:hypothetical protein